MKTIKVFFYGLFMDTEVLLKNGVHASNPKKAYAEGYALKIGNRASLIPSKGNKAYGILMEVNDGEILKLYAEKSVADYIAEKITVVTESQEQHIAICYNLPLALLIGTNKSYVKSLYELVKQKKFPHDYLDKIRMMAE